MSSAVQYPGQDATEDDLRVWFSHMYASGNFTEPDLSRMRHTPPHVEGGVRWSDAGKKLNGKVGKVTTSEVNEEGRHSVEVEGTKGTKLMKEGNIVDIPVSDLRCVCRKNCLGEEGGEFFIDTLLFPRQHSLFQNNQLQGNCPVMSLCGFPLVVKKATPRTKLYERADYDNVMATWMMVDPNTGLAPMQWQSGVGPVYVYRPNGDGHVTADDLELVHDYCSMLLDGYGEGDLFDPKEEVSLDRFKEYVSETKSDRDADGRSLMGLTILAAIDREMADWAANMLWQR
ncbi:MAG: hypothetical protein SGARI_004658 [Bacillariaceae sp.]